MHAVLDKVDALAAHVEKHLATTPDELVEFRSSEFDHHRDRFERVEQMLGAGMPTGLGEFYERCDGFTDNRYTNIDGLAAFLDEIGMELPPLSERMSIAGFGDGCGMDEKSIVLLHPELFEDAEARFMFHDYVLSDDDFEFMRDRVQEFHRARFDAEYPPFKSYRGPVDDRDNAEFLHFGPASLAELLDYILATARMI